MRGWPRTFVGPLHTIIVHTKTEQTLRGMLSYKNKDFIVLRPASIATTDQNGAVIWSNVDGDVVIPMDNVDFWQEGVEAKLAGLTLELYEQ